MLNASTFNRSMLAGAAVSVALVFASASFTAVAAWVCVGAAVTVASAVNDADANTRATDAAAPASIDLLNVEAFNMLDYLL